MKKTLMAAALTFAMIGAPAWAGGGDYEERQPEGEVVTPPEEGTGGAGMEEVPPPPEEPMEPTVPEGEFETAPEEGTGGAGMEEELYPAPEQEPVQPVQPETNIEINVDGEERPQEQQPLGGAGMEGEQPEQIVIQTEEPAAGEKEYDTSGLQVFAGGGVEGYTGDLAPQISPGPAWGAGVAFKPTNSLGVELGYSGAVNNIGEDFALDSDIVKNGGLAVATLGLPTRVSPYLLGGIGVDWYNVRGGGGAFQDDTIGYVPVGVGLRTQFGGITADARVTGDGMFSQDFAVNEGATAITDDEFPTARYNGMIRLGGQF